jgi:quercetin dioxygenase-like cupin family protein
MANESSSPQRVSPNLYDELLKLRDQQREKQRQARSVVYGDDLPWEINPQGKIKWYLHPTIDDTVIQTLIVYLQEIPPGSSSGKQKTQGGTVIFVVDGKGHTVIDDASYTWEKEDVVQIPIRHDGVFFQHFNDDQREPAYLICAEPNLVNALGVDRGSGFEQLAPAPEFKAKKIAAPPARGEAPVPPRPAAIAEVFRNETHSHRHVPSAGDREVDTYERVLELHMGQIRRGYEGKIVVRGRERPVEKSRQGWLRYYLYGELFPETALQEWGVFLHEIHAHTGKHSHQGGLAIFVLDGNGYTVLEGRKLAWKKGDLLLLPIKPGGVEHQHFNNDPNKPARWLAFIYWPYNEAMAHYLEHQENSR